MEPYAALVSLGCAKNLVDSEIMVPQLLSLGYTMTAEPARAKLILVNTCGFLESAVEEAIDTILSLSEHKTTGSCRYLIVAGCMVQRYGKKLVRLLPEVDLFIGTSHYHRLEEALHGHQRDPSRRLWISPPRHLINHRTPRLRSTPSYSAYVKIAEGCSNRCSYCLIPKLRGPYRSRTVEDVFAEVDGYDAQGVVEVNLIAQDVTAFGLDHDDPSALVRLLESLESLANVKWIRLLYAYPYHINGSLLRTMSQSSKIVPYLDIPFQHCVPGILKAMHRRHEDPDVEKLIDTVRSCISGIVLRTSLMVGFPGETEKDFEDLIRFVERVQFDHAGVFTFSPEAGAPAAKLPRQIDDEVKKQRYHHLMELQKEISRNRLERWVGSTLPVLIEGVHPETEYLLVGRTSTQAPEVDGTVIITEGTAYPGEIVSVHITDCHHYDLEGRINRLSQDGSSRENILT